MPTVNGFGSTSVDNVTIENNTSGQLQVKDPYKYNVYKSIDLNLFTFEVLGSRTLTISTNTSLPIYNCGVSLNDMYLKKTFRANVGNYKFSAYLDYAPFGGILSLYLNGTKIIDFDSYNSSYSYNHLITTTLVLLEGENYIEFKNESKNSSSSGYYITSGIFSSLRKI